MNEYLHNLLTFSFYISLHHYLGDLVKIITNFKMLFSHGFKTVDHVSKTSLDIPEASPHTKTRALSSIIKVLNSCE